MKKAILVFATAILVLSSCSYPGTSKGWISALKKLKYVPAKDEPGYLDKYVNDGILVVACVDSQFPKAFDSEVSFAICQKPKTTREQSDKAFESVLRDVDNILSGTQKVVTTTRGNSEELKVFNKPYKIDRIDTVTYYKLAPFLVSVRKYGRNTFLGAETRETNSYRISIIRR